MISVLSPAKTLDMMVSSSYPTTTPDYLSDSRQLISVLRNKTVAEIRSLMHLSDKLAELNYQRYQAWNPEAKEIIRPAVYYFKGDVYQGLEAEQFNQREIEFAQHHLRILSGLYGLLKPLDAISPYRLEMGTQLANNRGNNLYDFWCDKLTEKVQDELRRHEVPAIVNLASQEYAKAIDFNKIEAPIITPIFKDEKNGVFKMISFYAKKARGMMAAYMVKNQITTPEQLSGFNTAGYQFIEETHKKNNQIELLFHRKAA